jgi:histidyl-tRNA synthetase
VGENEVAGDCFAVKNLATGEQVAIARDQLAVKLSS